MGAMESVGKSNDELVDNLVEGDSIKKKEIELIMRLVDRGRFIPREHRDSAYKDSAWKSETGNPGFLHLSAPCIYASVLENINLERGMSFLNIGSGTGYLSTMAGFLLGDTGVNHGIELYENVVNYSIKKAGLTLSTSEVSAFEWCIPQFFHGNAFQLKTEMRYDRIYCGALVPHSRRSYFCNLLNVGGSLIMPYGNSLLRIVRQSETQFVTYDVSSVMFSHFVQPDPEREFTQKSVVIPLMQPQRLIDTCRNQIRRYVRAVTSVNFPLEMRSMCSKPKQFNDRVSNAGDNQNPGNEVRDQNVHGRRRFRAIRLGRVYIIWLGQRGGADENRQALEDRVIAQIGNRLAGRHREVRIRNIRNHPVAVFFPHEDLGFHQIDERDDVADFDIAPPPEIPARNVPFELVLAARGNAHHIVANNAPEAGYMLDDADFELNKGFRFKRGRTEDNEQEENELHMRDRVRHVINWPDEEADEGIENVDAHVIFEQPMQQEEIEMGAAGLQEDIIDDDNAINNNEENVDDLQDGIGHALDDPIADENDVLNESFAESNESHNMDNEHLDVEDHEVHEVIDVDSDDEEAGNSDEDEDEDEQDLGDNDGEEDLAEEVHQIVDDVEEASADQIEGARRQAAHLAAFHANFTDRLNRLPVTLAMHGFLKYQLPR